MTRICKTHPCPYNCQQSTIGCVNADYCPCFTTDMDTILEANVDKVPIDHWIVPNNLKKLKGESNGNNTL